MRLQRRTVRSTSGEDRARFLRHVYDDNGNSLFGLDREDIDETLDVGAEAIPTTVPAVYKGIRIVTRE